MKTLVIYMLETLVCSGVLLSAYMILLERRVHFHWCRIFLMTLPLLAGLIPLLRIPVWPGAVIATSPTVTADKWDTAGRIITDAGTTFSPLIFCTATYLFGTTLLLGLMCWQIARIRRLRRDADITRTGNYTLGLTRQKIASFSFFRSVYIWAGTPQAEMNIIIAHEASHIAHRHSVERIVMECFKAAMWWNPFVWIAARRLTEAEEFEADHDVLHGGYDTTLYMNTIFKQLFGYSPDIANGLRNSLTKKRFQMMTTKTMGRYGLLRLAGTVPAVLGLLCAFSFTTKAAVIIPSESDPDNSVRTEQAQEALFQNDVKKNSTATRPAPAPPVKRTTAATAPAPATTKPAPPVLKPVTKTPPAAAIPQSETKNEEPTFVRAEVMPKFQGGDLNAYRNWLQSNVKYPMEALEKQIAGRVILTFIIEKDGSISNFEILQSPHESLSAEARRVVSKTPAGAWIPGMQRGQKVRIQYTMPLEFRVQGSNSNPSPDSQAGSTDNPGLVVTGYGK